MVLPGLDILNWIITLSWFIPLYFTGAALAGNYFHRKKLRKYFDKYRIRDVNLVIFQVPTTGRAIPTLKRIMDQVKAYDKDLPHQVTVQTWVIIEEADDDPKKYEGWVDRVITVPKEFQCYAKAKARALEYSRRLRRKLVEQEKLPPKYMMVQGDDDSIPSIELIDEALHMHDTGLISAMVLPHGGNWWTRTTDLQRIYACACTCNLYTNIDRPTWGHGEAMIYDHKVDEVINNEFIPLNGKILKSYDEVPHMGNEDMYYTHKVEMAGFKTFNSTKTVSIQSPFTFSDLKKQRRRWMWGNFNIVYKKRWLPFSHAIRFFLMHTVGIGLYPLSKAGLILDLIGIIQLSPEQRYLSWIGFGAWLFIRFYSSYRLKGWKAGIKAMALAQITTTLDYIALINGLIRGDPKKFEVIKK